MILTILEIIGYLLSILFWIVIIQVVLSWLFVFKVVNPYSPFVANVSDVLERITRPFYKPIRRILPDFGGIDLSPMVLLFGIIILRDYILVGVAREVIAATGPTVL